MQLDKETEYRSYQIWGYGYLNMQGGEEYLDKDQSILTKREKEIFDLLASSKSTSEIASELDISEKTVRNHISNVILKLGVKGRSQAIIELLKLGVVSL